MILIRFAITLFALALLGMAISLSSAQSEQEQDGYPRVASVAVTVR